MAKRMTEENADNHYLVLRHVAMEYGWSPDSYGDDPSDEDAYRACLRAFSDRLQCAILPENKTRTMFAIYALGADFGIDHNSSAEYFISIVNHTVGELLKYLES